MQGREMKRACYVQGSGRSSGRPWFANTVQESVCVGGAGGWQQREGWVDHEDLCMPH